LELDLLTKKKTKTKTSRIALKESAKIQELEATIQQLEDNLSLEKEKVKEYLTSLKYMQADFENYRKRSEKETQEAVSRSNEKLLSCLIGVLDDFENAILAGETTENKEALLEGVSMVHKNLEKLLTQEGLVRLECVGQAFNPNLHEILTQVPTNEHQNGIVLEEARKGFLFKGKVLRPSVVKVACNTLEGDKKNE